MHFLQNRDTQTLIPLTVKQISESLQSSDDKMNFTLDGVDVNNVGFFSRNKTFFPFILDLASLWNLSFELYSGKVGWIIAE